MISIFPKRPVSMKAATFVVFGIISLSATAEISENINQSTGLIYREYQTEYDSGSRHFSAGSLIGRNRDSTLFVLRFSQISRNRYYQNCRVGFLVNDERLDVGPSEYQMSDLSGGYVLETVRVYPSALVMEASGNAKTVQYRICDDKFDLKAEDIRGIKELVTRTK